MRPALIIAVRELRSRLRDRSAWIVGFLAPVALAVIIALAFAGGEDAIHADVGLVDADGGALATTFRRDVLGSIELAELVTVQPFDDRQGAVDALQAGGVDAVIVLASGLDRIEVVRAARAEVAGHIALSIVRGFAAQVDGVSRTVAASVMVRAVGADAFDDDGFHPERIDPSAVRAPDDLDVEALAAELAEGPVPIDLREASAGASGLTPASYFGPGMAMLFVFFSLAAAPRSLLAERRAGTLARVLAAPIPAASIIAGKALAAAVLGFAGMATVWGVTAWAFGAWWGDPLAVVAVLLAFLTAAAGIATLACVLARTDNEADGLVSAVAFVSAMLGGNFVFLGDMPPALRTVAAFTPNGQAMQAFTTLTADGGGVASVAGNLAAILAFAAVTFALAAPGLRRWVTA